MGYTNTILLDLLPEYIKNNTTIMHVCSALPTVYTDLASYSLGSVTMGISDFSNIKSGLTSGGRRVSVLDKEVTISLAGTIKYIAIASATVLFHVEESASTIVVAGDVYNILEWDLENAP